MKEKYCCESRNKDERLRKQTLTQNQIWAELRHAKRSSITLRSCVLGCDLGVKLQQSTQALAAVDLTGGWTGCAINDPTADALMRALFVVELSELFHHTPQVSLTKKNKSIQLKRGEL